MSILSAGRFSSHARLFSATVAALAVGGMLAAGISAPAFATTPGSLTVKVTNRSGVALTDIDVVALQVANGAEVPNDPAPEADAVSGRPGYYEIDSLPAGTYTLGFFPTGSTSTTAFSQLLGGVSDFDKATVFTMGSADEFESASLAGNGIITGKVTSPSGKALAGVAVQAYNFNGSGWFPDGYTFTNSSGLYTLTNIDPGSYRFEYYPPKSDYAPIYSGGAHTIDSAASTYVGLGATATVNVKFTVGTGSITGTARLFVGGDDFGFLKSATAVAFPVIQQSGGSATKIDIDKGVYGAPSSSKGVWSISNLPTGDYVVQMQPGFVNEAQQWLGTGDPSEPLASARIYHVTTGHKTSAGTEVFAGDLNSGAEISVTVFDGSSTTVHMVGAVVTATNDTNSAIEISGTTDHTGEADLAFEGDTSPADVPPGYYTITVVEPGGTRDPYTTDEYVDFEDNITDLVVHLPALTTAPGFSSPATIAETNTVVGTPYSVAATAARGDAELTYQWLRNEHPIYGATAASYLSTGSDADAQLSVRVTATSFGFDPVYSEAYVGGETPTPETAADAPTNSTAPSFTPAADVHVGTVLNANPGVWSVDGLHFDYQWTRDGASIGTDSPRYTVTDADLTHELGLLVTPTKPGYANADQIAATTTVTPSIQAAPTIVTPPVVTTTLSHGTTKYSATAGTWSVSGTTPTFLWQIDGSTVSTGPTYSTTTPSSDDALYLHVDVTKDGYTPGSTDVLVRKGTAAFVSSSPAVVTDVTQSAVITSPDQTIRVGDQLTVTTPGTWSYLGAPPDKLNYRWMHSTGSAAPAPISKATALSYTVTPSDVGTTISLAETPFSFVRTGTPPRIEAEGFVQPGTALASSPPTVTVSGAPANGNELTAKIGAWPIHGIKQTLQWYACFTGSACSDPTDPSQFQKVAGHTKTTIAAKSTYLSVQLRVRATAAGYESGEADSAPIVIAGPNDIATATPPAIHGGSAGSAHIGQTLTLTPGKYSVSSLVRSYVWQVQVCSSVCAPDSWVTASGAGATSSVFTPNVADYGSGGVRIRVEESVHNSHGSQVADSATVGLSLGIIGVTHAATASLAASTYTVNPATYSVASGVTTWQWYVDGVAQSDTTATFDSTGHSGAAIYVDITYTVDNYTPLVTRLIAAKGSAPTIVTDHVVGANYGDTLSLANSPFAYPGTGPGVTPPTYQWYSGSKAIAGQTHSTFKPTTAYTGKIISVRVASTSPYYANGHYTSSPVILGAGSFGTPAVPTIAQTGAAYPGNVSTVTRGAGYSTTTGVTFATQWQRTSGSTWVSIPGATGPTYTPVLSDIGAQLRVSISATKSGYTKLTIRSAAETVGYAPTLVALAPPSVVSAQVGHVATADPGDWNTPSLTYGYQWYRNGVAIPGATSATFTPTATSYGDELVVQVTATRSAYQPVTASSNSVKVLVGDAPTTTSTAAITPSGGVYTVSTPSWTVDGLSYAYQWQVAGVDATGAGATTDRYTPAGGDSGALTVIITATRFGYADGHATIGGVTLTP